MLNAILYLFAAVAALIAVVTSIRLFQKAVKNDAEWMDRQTSLLKAYIGSGKAEEAYELACKVGYVKIRQSVPMLAGVWSSDLFHAADRFGQVAALAASNPKDPILVEEIEKLPYLDKAWVHATIGI